MLLGLLGLLTPATLAFAPNDDVYQGIEPGRVMRVHAARQARLREQDAWRAFTAAGGYGWQARFDERTGTPWRAWGPGIDMGNLATEKDAVSALRRLVADNPDLVGVPLHELELRAVRYIERTDTWYVDFDRLVSGVPIWRGGVTARIKHGNLVLLGVETYPDLENVEPATVSDASAIRAAALAGPAALAEHTDESAELVVLPLEIEGQLVYRLTWEVRSRTASPPGWWVSHVDAHTGELLNVYNQVRFLDGRLYATHDTRTVDGSYSTSPVPLAYLTGASSGTRVTAGNDGAFAIDATESWSTGLRGTYLTVHNEAGAEGSLTFTGAEPTWTTDSADQAEIDTYVFLHHVRDWGLRFAPEVEQVTSPLLSKVNLNDVCNAYWDGNVNFYREGSGCNNTGRIADVNYHEWGHGFHYYSIASEWDFDGSVSEGIGDVVSMLQTLDPEIAPYFGTNGASIRELETNHRYPEDVTGAVHQDGLIFGGAMWDLYLALSDTYGEAPGTKGTAWEVTSRLLVDGIKGGPTIPETYDEILVADDDNGDLSDGTPHMCEIVEAFGYHGLGPLGGGDALLNVFHAALGNQRSGTPIAVGGEIVNTSAACVDFTLDGVEAVYSTDGGASWDVAPLSVAGEAFEGELPAQPAGTVVSYYLRASGTDGTEVTAPAGGEIAPYTFFVGGLEEIYCEPFDDDGGYTHELVDGPNQQGADDWVHGQPGGYADDPDEAFTGRSVWGNDLGGGQYNGEYQAGITNRLTSVDIDVGDASPIVIQYRRWLNVEDGVYDQARVYLDDEVVWDNYATSEREGTSHTEDREWMLHTILAEPASSVVKLGWEIESDGGLEFGGWNIDDVCVFRVTEEAPDDTGGDPDDDDRPGVDDTDDGTVVIGGACGCDAGAGGAGGLVAAAAGLLALARRRRDG